ncbi:type II secretion system protein GspD [uncultured Sphingorhabdus sp.]|uniref:type II secretion system protein GspD n=1 Tax=uncultured Sphingorhabdus sp. TaxID=1686106 RepID=UPI00262ACEA8|nr:secretin N-terminal domain-containing protein [uncultured Sphingorhabdus sp.]
MLAVTPQRFGILQQVLLLLALCCAILTPASAQTPSVVEELQLVTEDADQTSFILRFSPQEPQASPLNTDPSRPAVAMRATLRAPRVAEFHRYRGLVRSARFETTAGSLVLRFETGGPASVSVQPAGNKALQIRVERVSVEEATGTRPIGSQNEAVYKASDLSAAQGASEGDSYELIPLKYADVSEIIGLLVEGATAEPNNVFIRREPGFGSPGSNSQGNYFNPPQQQQEAQKPLGQSFGNGIAIDRRLNAIWVTGSSEKIARIKEQIAMIDVPVDSVILETQFVELTEQGAKNLGIDLNNNAGQLAVGTLQTGSFLPFGVDPNDVLPSGALQAAIYAQVERGEGRIVSRPRIAAQSGSTAKIITGDALPILTAITLSGVNGVSQQVQYVNVGVTLQIAPRVSADGFVTSQIYGVVSSVTGFSQGYPTISQREAETSASVRDGETFVVGGLTQENVITNKSKVPLLGDIPLVGNLFKLERSTRSKTELYIVITPHIVRHRRFQPEQAQDIIGTTENMPN